MADICACCGKVVHGYFNVEIDQQTYKLCEGCDIKMKKTDFRKRFIIAHGQEFIGVSKERRGKN